MVKKDYKILWLYGDLLDLYGDSGNIKMIAHRLTEMGRNVEFIEKSIYDDFSYEGIDLVYMGAGKARNLCRAGEHFLKYKDATLAAVENGLTFLVTGNSRLLFGKSYETYDGKTAEGIGLFNYTARETGKVFISDVVAVRADTDCSKKSYGFINRTAHIDGNNEHIWFKLFYGSGDDEKPTTHTEGNRYKNFFGTWQMGPILCKNPHLLRAVLSAMAPDETLCYDEETETMALNLTLKEFELQNPVDNSHKVCHK